MPEQPPDKLARRRKIAQPKPPHKKVYYSTFEIRQIDNALGKIGKSYSSWVAEWTLAQARKILGLTDE